MDSPTSTTNVPVSPVTAPQGTSSARKVPGLLVDIPTEMFRMMASNLNKDDLRSLSLTCRKTHEEVKAVLFQSPSIDIGWQQSKLRLLVRSCYSPPGSTLALNILSLTIEYNPMDPRFYRQGAKNVARIRRLGNPHPDDDLEERSRRREDYLLHRLLCASKNLRVLRLEAFGDLLPVMVAPAGFLRNLRSLHLRRIPHGYADNAVGHFVDRSRDGSMKTLAWIFQLPRLKEVTLDNFGDLHDVGLVSATLAGKFTPSALTLIETSVAPESCHCTRHAIACFFRAFKALECAEWLLSSFHFHKIQTVAWIVDGLRLHRNTLKTLVLSGNKVRMTVVDQAALHRLALPAELFHYVDFTPFRALESLCIMDHALFADNMFDPRSKDHDRAFQMMHRLPSSLKQLCIIPLGHLSYSIEIAGIIRLWNGMTNFLPQLRPHKIYFVAIGLKLLVDDGRVSSCALQFRDAASIAQTYGRVPDPWEPLESVLIASQAIMERFCLERMRRWHQLPQAMKDRWRWRLE